MKKKLLIALVFGMILLVGTVTAIITLDNGDLVLENGELAGVTNNQIANYMENSFDLTRHKVMDDKIIVYYDITYVEPTHDGAESFIVFTQEKPFKISIELWNECLSKTDKDSCKTILVDRDTPFVYDTGEVDDLDEPIMRTIYSTYYQAEQEQLRQFERTKTFRDKAIENEMEELGNLL